MRSEGGWNLIELMVVVTLITAVGGTVLGVASVVRGEERHSAACANDLRSLRNAVRVLEQDLRSNQAPPELPWRLEAGTLRRGEKVYARNIARFDVSWDEDLASVHIALGPRTDASSRREATLDLRVRRRVPPVREDGR